MKPPKKKPKKIVPMRYPLSQEIAYKRNLKWMNKQLRLLCDKYLVPEFESLAMSAMPPDYEVRQDAPSDDWLIRLNDLIDKLNFGMRRPVQITIQQLDEIGVGTENFNKKEWNRLIRNSYGVTPTEKDPGKYDAKLKQWAEYNARLIQDIPNKTIQQIRDQTIEALVQGTNVKDTTNAMQDILNDRLDVSDSRAELIARDQVSKLNGDLVKSRQEDNDVTHYIWRSVMDERVRDSHREAEDNTYSWAANGSDTPCGYIPGQDFQCRCTAEPILPLYMDFRASLNEAA